MLKFIVTLILLWLCLAGRSQLYIQSGTGFKTTGDVQITLDSINVANDDESADFSSCILIFKGSTSTSIGGTGAWVIKKIIIDKAAAQLALLVPIKINSQLQFVNGKLELNNQNLTLSSEATLQGETENNRIIGANGGSVQTTVSLDAPSAQNPGNIGAQITSSQNLGSVTIKRWHQPDGGSPGKVFRFYEIVPSNNIALNASLRLYYLDAELNNNSENSLELFSRNSIQNNWTVLNSTTKDASSNYIEKTGLGSLRQYSFGNNNVIVSPVTWGTISASCKRGQIQVKWSTLQESGVYNFIVQRSTNGSVWTDLGSVPGSGNSTSPKNYSYMDASAPSGTTLFYRIAAVQNESYFYSPVTSTTACKKPVILQLAPVPATTTTNLSVYSEESYQSTIKLYGVDGHLYEQKQVTIINGYSRFQFDVSRVPNGTYFLSVELPDGTQQSVSFVKQ